MRQFLLITTLLLVLLFVSASAPHQVQGEVGDCQAPCQILGGFINEQGQLCITSYCPCTGQTTTECRDIE